MAARGRGGRNFIASFYDLWESCVLLCVYATLEPSPELGAEPCSSSFPLSRAQSLSLASLSNSSTSHPSAFYKHHDMKASPDFYASRIWCALEKFSAPTFFFSLSKFSLFPVYRIFTIFKIFPETFKDIVVTKENVDRRKGESEEKTKRIGREGWWKIRRSTERSKCVARWAEWNGEGEWRWCKVSRGRSTSADR